MATVDHATGVCPSVKEPMMTADDTVAGEQLATPAGLTRTTLRPRFEYAGPHSRLGIRGLTSLAEETLVHWFRVRGISPSVLYDRYGRIYAIVDWSSLCSGVLSLDDEVAASAHPVGVRHFNVQLAVRVGEAERVPLRGRVTAVLVRRPGVFEDPPEEVSGMLVDSVDQVRPAVPGHDPDYEAMDLARRMASGTLGWHRSSRVPMDGCHQAGRMQHSTVLRLLAELAEVFAEDHGLPARRLLDEHGLVAVVPRLRLRLLADACAGEVLHMRYEVHQVVGGNLFDCRFDAHVVRDGRPVPVAAGILLQGFARVDDPAGRAADLSPSMIEGMTGGGRSTIS
jgi:acyl-CoA thioesterase FadM